MIEIEFLNPATILKWFKGDFYDHENFYTSDKTSSIVETLTSLNPLSVSFIAVLFLFIYLWTAWFNGNKGHTRQRLTRRCKNIWKRFKGELIFNGVIRIFSVIYIQLCVSAGYTVEMHLRSRSTSSGQAVLTVLFFLLIFLIPLMSIRIILLNREQLEEPFVAKKISNLVQGIHLYRERQNVWYFPIFLLRRLIFIAIPTLWYFWAFFQIQILMSLTTIYVIAYGAYRPHREPGRRRLEMFNESMTMVLVYHLVIFSRFVTDERAQYKMGNTYLCTIAFIIVINVINVLSERCDRKLR